MTWLPALAAGALNDTEKEPSESTVPEAKGSASKVMFKGEPDRKALPDMVTSEPTFPLTCLPEPSAVLICAEAIELKLYETGLNPSVI
jgi:hypothetical protein